MRNKLVILGCLCLFTIGLISCSEEPTTSTLRVELDKGTRTISPSDGSMEIIGYRIVPTGPDGKEASTRYTYYSYCNLENLAYGKWKIEAYGFNSDKIDIAYGSTEVMITGGDNKTVINVHKVIGKGDLSISFTWDKTKIKDPVLNLYLKAQDNSQPEIELSSSITKSEGKASLEHPNLQAGSYTLRGELLDSDTKVAGFIEAVRISNQKTTKGTIPFEIGKLEEEKPDSGGSSLDISNTTSSPVEIKIEGVEKIISRKTSFTATLSILSKNVTQGQLKADWYLDGIHIGNGLSCSISSGEIGDHRIDVIASTSSNGSTGSTFATFSTVATTKQGMPYSLRQVKDTDISLGDSNVIRFLPNGKLVVVSNDLATIEIISLDNGEIAKKNSYNFSELNIEGTVSDIAASGIASDSNLTLYVFTNNKPSIIALSYTRNGDSLSFKGKQTNIKSHTGDAIENFGPALGISNGGALKYTVVAASTLNHQEKGLLFLNPNPVSHDNNYIKANYMYGRNLFGEGPLYNIDYSETSDAITTVTGSVGIVYQPRLTGSGLISMNPTPVSDDINKVMNQDFESFTRGIMGRIFDKVEGRGYVLTNSALYIYQNAAASSTCPIVQKDKSFYFTSHMDKIPALQGSYDNLYFYMLDNLCKKLYVLEFYNGSFHCDKDNDFINLPTNKYTKIEISRDGRNIVLYNPSGSTNDIAILRITR